VGTYTFDSAAVGTPSGLAIFYPSLSISGTAGSYAFSGTGSPQNCGHQRCG
jgi:hypothetical protein